MHVYQRVDCVLEKCHLETWAFYVNLSASSQWDRIRILTSIGEFIVWATLRRRLGYFGR